MSETFSPLHLLMSQLESGQAIMTKAVADISEAEFHARLPGRGESVNWIFGHLAVNEDWFLMKLTGAPLQLSNSLHEKYRADESPPADPATPLNGRDEILRLFQDQRARVIGEVRRADVSIWGSPAPGELPPLFPTRGAVWGVLGTHQYWHLGQIMTIRQMLAKPDFRF
jgi:hypothetical protein